MVTFSQLQWVQWSQRCCFYTGCAAKALGGLDDTARQLHGSMGFLFSVFLVKASVLGHNWLIWCVPPLWQHRSLSLSLWWTSEDTTKDGWKKLHAKDSKPFQSVWKTLWVTRWLQKQSLRLNAPQTVGFFLPQNENRKTALPGMAWPEAGRATAQGVL